MVKHGLENYKHTHRSGEVRIIEHYPPAGGGHNDHAVKSQMNKMGLRFEVFTFIRECMKEELESDRQRKMR